MLEKAETLSWPVFLSQDLVKLDKQVRKYQFKPAKTLLDEMLLKLNK